MGRIRNLQQLEWKNRFTYLKNICFTERDLNCPGAKFQIVKFLPLTKIGPHYHKNVMEIFYIRQGTCTIKLDGIEYHCKEDDFLLCNAGTIHEIINNDNELIILIFKTNEEEKDIYWINHQTNPQLTNSTSISN